MKPLTIEELKALPVGDWVWIKHGEVESYFRKDVLADNQFATPHFMYSDYGTKWIAYKNKEQAETNGEWVELPCKIGDTVYYIPSYFGENGLEYDEVRETKFDYIVFQGWRFSVFLTKDEAEARLKELRGEK